MYNSIGTTEIFGSRNISTQCCENACEFLSYLIRGLSKIGKINIGWVRYDMVRLYWIITPYIILLEPNLCLPYLM